MPERDPIADLDGLYLAAKRLVDGLYVGRHASPLRGSGIEFHDYRPYTPGDDLRDIDWKRYGRTDRYYLKRYRRETDLNLHVVVDGSASMDFAAIKQAQRSMLPTKFAAAKRLAAALATLAVRQGDRAGLAVFDDALRCVHPATGSIRRLQTMLADLEAAEPASGRAHLADALAQLARTLGQRKAAIAIISDLLDEVGPMLEVFDRLRFAGHEVIVFQVLTPDELSLPQEAGGVRLIDPETGPAVNTRPKQVAAEYQSLIETHLATLRRSIAARNTDYLLVRTNRPMLVTLRQYLQQRASRSR